MNFQTLAFHAERMLGKLQPEALKRPEAVDLVTLLAGGIGVDIESASACELGEVEGYYHPNANLIVLREDVWEAIEHRCDMTHRARATFAHELSHFNLDGISMDEDDAWAHAGCLLMPCEMVASLDTIDDVNVSRVFDVSPQFAYKHLWRMKKARLL